MLSCHFAVSPDKLWSPRSPGLPAVLSREAGTSPTAQSAPADTPVPGEGASSLAPLRSDGSPNSVSTEKANCNV